MPATDTSGASATPLCARCHGALEPSAYGGYLHVDDDRDDHEPQLRWLDSRENRTVLVAATLWVIVAAMVVTLAVHFLGLWRGLALVLIVTLVSRLASGLTRRAYAWVHRAPLR